MGAGLDISWTGLALSGLLVLIVLAVSSWQKLGLEARILTGVFRTVIQLVAVGYVLGWILDASRLDWTLFAIAVQLAFAVWSAGSLLNHPLRNGWRLVLASLLPAYLCISLLLMLLIIAPEPRWNPRFLLPLGGMLLGNALAGTVLGLNHYRALVSADRDLIMARLALGVAWFVAVEEERQHAAQAAMLPTISAMLTVGVVSLPGMMTGQIIAGASPLTAVRYQIVVMFMIAAATGIAVLIALHLMCRRERFEDLDSGPVA